MKVLHIIKTNIGAAWAYKQIEKLLLTGIQISVMLPRDDTGYALEYKKLGVNIIPFDASLPIKKPWKIFHRIWAFRRIVESIKPDIIHCHFVTNIMFCRIALWKVNVPRLFQVPGPLHLENLFFRYAEVLLSNKNDYWAGSCLKTCSIYRSMKIPENRIFFGYYVGDYDQNAKNAVRTGKLRKEFNIPEDTFLIGTVSYFYKPKYYMLQFYGIKGHEDFIKAFSMVNRKYPNTKAMIIGGPAPNSEKYMERVMKLAKNLCGDNIIFAGYREDIVTIYPDFDLAVHPSRSENYGGCGESLSLGIPTLTTDVGGFPDFIKNNITGYLTPAANPVKLARKMAYILNHYNKAQKVAKEGQKFISNINSDLGARQAYNMYEQILKQRL